MTLPFPVLLVAHQGFGEGLLSAVEAILGEVPSIDLMTNHGLSPEVLGEKLDHWLDSHPGPSLILTDLGFGSCCQTARKITHGREQVGVVAGVNLPLLLAAIRSREHGDLEAFLRHLSERGRGGVLTYLNGEEI